MSPRLRPSRLLLMMGIPLLLQGCVFTWVDITTPADGYSQVTTLRYGEGNRQTLDLYSPASASTKPQTLVFFYGGAWQRGKKDNYRFVAQAFTQAGYRTAIPDYRVYPEGRFPDFLEDGADTIARLLEAEPEAQLVLVGHSAGAHIAAMLAQDPRYLEAAGVNQNRVQAWVGWSGPYDFLPLTSERLEKIFEQANPLEDSQPIEFASAGDPPALLIQGQADSTVLPHNTENLAAKMRNANVPVTTVFYPDVGHIGTVGALAPVFRDWSDTLGDTLQFLENLPTSTP